MKKKLKEFFSEFLNKKFLISIIAMMGVMPVLYWGVKFFQVNYHYIYSSIDNKIPFIPQLVPIYDLYYPTVLLTMYYLFRKDRKHYYRGIIAAVIGNIICCIIFIAYPTIMFRPFVDYSSLDWFTGLVLKITYAADVPALNCCPSLHCLFCYQAIFSLCLSKNIKKKVKIPLSLFLFLIVLTTLFVKQHYFYDAVYAFIIFAVVNIIVYVFKLSPKITCYIKKKYNIEDNKKKSKKNKRSTS